MAAHRPQPYDPQWATRFEKEASLLQEALEPWLIDGVHHVGSTSIPGMTAKPVIDMLAGVRDLDEARAAFEPLARLHYGYREHRRDAHAFCKPPNMPSQWEETHHLHLTVPGSDLWRERLAFRDALRADRALVREYSDWKLRYYGSQARLSKRPFVERVLASAGVSLKPDDERLAAATLTERRRRFVLVAGPPGAGKTTLAEPLAVELGLPLIAKDPIKEALMTSLGTPRSVEESRAMGGAAVRALLAVAATTRGAVLESTFYPETIGALRTLSGRFVEVRCSVPREVALTRYRARRRHPGHFETARTDEELWSPDLLEPLGLGPVIVVDTTTPVAVPALAAQVNAVFDAET